jgi:hypothetical protein
MEDGRIETMARRVSAAAALRQGALRRLVFGVLPAFMNEIL